MWSRPKPSLKFSVWRGDSHGGRIIPECIAHENFPENPNQKWLDQILVGKSVSQYLWLNLTAAVLYFMFGPPFSCFSLSFLSVFSETLGNSSVLPAKSRSQGWESCCLLCDCPRPPWSQKPQRPLQERKDSVSSCCFGGGHQSYSGGSWGVGGVENSRMRIGGKENAQGQWGRRGVNWRGNLDNGPATLSVKLLRKLAEKRHKFENVGE